MNSHALLTAVLGGLTELGPSSEALLEMMRDETIEECEDRATEMGLSSNTCAAAVDANYPPLDELNLHVNCSMGTCVVSEDLVLWALANPEEYMLGNGGEVVLVELTGGQLGFEFTAAGSGSLAEALGFEEEDIVTEVNNLEVGDLDNSPAIVNGLVNADTAVVSYRRGSAEYDLIVTVDD